MDCFITARRFAAFPRRRPLIGRLPTGELILMNYRIRLSRRWLALLLLLAAALATGCSPTQPFYFFEDGDLSHYVGVATNIEYPALPAAR